MTETPQEQKQDVQVEAPKPQGTVLVAGVQFQKAGKIYSFTTTDASLALPETVVVETEGGAAIGCIATAPHEVPEESIPKNSKKILHRATKEEIEEEAMRREKALEYFALCREKIRERSLPMKLVDAHIEEGGKKIVFVFYAEQRVDFRSLVKDLAGALHMRIEMRQIGSRDESKHLGCMGPCGLSTCCNTHLRQFQSISISMAKHQGIAPNPAKLTGMCGKLKCCLAYENAVYLELRQGLPKIGAAVMTPTGAGKISGISVIKRECSVKLYSGGDTRCPCDSCRQLTSDERDAALEAARQAEELSEERSRRVAQRRQNSKK